MTPRNMTPEESYRYYYAEGEFALAQLYKSICESEDYTTSLEKELNDKSECANED